MGVWGRRSRVGDTVDVTAARLRRGAHDVLDAAGEAAGGLGDRVVTQVVSARRDLADAIDPAPLPRRGLRLLAIGLFVTTVSAVVWALLARRPQVTPPRGAPEHLPSTVTDDPTPAPAAGATSPDGTAPGVDPDAPPVAGLTGDPEAKPG